MSKKKKNNSYNDFIPYEKSSKSEKRRRDRERRNDWGEISPTIKVIPNKKKKKEKRKRDDYYSEDWGDYEY